MHFIMSLYQRTLFYFMWFIKLQKILLLFPKKSLSQLQGLNYFIKDEKLSKKKVVKL